MYLPKHIYIVICAPLCRRSRPKVPLLWREPALYLPDCSRCSVRRRRVYIFIYVCMYVYYRVANVAGPWLRLLDSLQFHLAQIARDIFIYIYILYYTYYRRTDIAGPWLSFLHPLQFHLSQIARDATFADGAYIYICIYIYMCIHIYFVLLFAHRRANVAGPGFSFLHPLQLWLSEIARDTAFADGAAAAGRIAEKDRRLGFRVGRRVVDSATPTANNLIGLGLWTKEKITIYIYIYIHIYIHICPYIYT